MWNFYCETDMKSIDQIGFYRENFFGRKFREEFTRVMCVDSGNVLLRDRYVLCHKKKVRVNTHSSISLEWNTIHCISEVVF